MTIRAATAAILVIVAGCASGEGGSAPADSAGPPATTGSPADTAQTVPEDTAATSSIRAFVRFAGPITEVDRAWLRRNGLVVVQTFEETQSVLVAVPGDFTGDPVAENPRIVEFEVRYR